MLDVRDLHAYYGKSHILHGVDLHVDEGEIVSLLGRNGVGRPERDASTAWCSVFSFFLPCLEQADHRSIAAPACVFERGHAVAVGEKRSAGEGHGGSAGVYQHAQLGDRIADR